MAQIFVQAGLTGSGLHEQSHPHTIHFLWPKIRLKKSQVAPASSSFQLNRLDYILSVSTLALKLIITRPKQRYTNPAFWTIYYKFVKKEHGSITTYIYTYTRCIHTHTCKTITYDNITTCSYFYAVRT